MNQGFPRHPQILEEAKEDMAQMNAVRQDESPDKPEQQMMIPPLPTKKK